MSLTNRKGNPVEFKYDRQNNIILYVIRCNYFVYPSEPKIEKILDSMGDIAYFELPDISKLIVNFRLYK